MSGLLSPKTPRITVSDTSATAKADAAAAAAAAEKRRRLVENALRGSTILTAGDGLPGDGSVARLRGKTLLGQ